MARCDAGVQGACLEEEVLISRVQVDALPFLFC